MSSQPANSTESTVAVPLELQYLEKILSSLDVLVYVADMQTHELLYVNEYGRSLWGEVGGRRCFEYLQSGQQSPCTFCTNHLLLDEQGAPRPVYVWEFQNTVTLRWYQCRDQAIRWVDGRLVRMEVAVDITERKEIEHKLEAAKREAEQLARVDELTRIGNRRAFFEQMQLQLANLQRQQQPMSLVMLDLDHFKQINDQHGHTLGDAVLVAVSQAVAASIRAGDRVFRIGGEEFVVVLPGCDVDGSFELVERIRTLISEMRFTDEESGQDFGVTCSFGIAPCTAGLGIDALLACADEAMYAAKAAGRNCTRVFAGGQVN